MLACENNCFYGVCMYILKRVGVIPPRRVDIVIDPFCFFEIWNENVVCCLSVSKVCEKRSILVLGCVGEALSLGGCFVWLILPSRHFPPLSCSRQKSKCRVAK